MLVGRYPDRPRVAIVAVLDALRRYAAMTAVSPMSLPGEGRLERDRPGDVVRLAPGARRRPISGRCLMVVSTGALVMVIVSIGPPTRQGA